MRLFLLFISLVCIRNNLFSDEGYEPLYAGTLLSFYPENTAPGHLSIQTYLYIVNNYGDYTPNWDLVHENAFNQQQLALSLETGITKFLDITLDIDGTYSQSHGGKSLLYGDTDVYLGFQILANKKGTWIPDLRILLGETFPTGKYDHLNPKKNGSDISGAGAYATSFILAVRKVFYLFPAHPFNFDLNLYYILSSKVHVEGFNFYQGAADTNGHVKPGGQFIANLAFEFSFTRNYAFGMDINYQHQDRSIFHGNTGGDGSPSYEQLSLTPCLEYSFNDNLSIEGGAWFTVLGRNTQAFATGFATVYYYF